MHNPAGDRTLPGRRVTSDGLRQAATDCLCNGWLIPSVGEHRGAAAAEGVR